MVAIPMAAWWGAAIVGSLAFSMFSSSKDFVPGVCDRLEPYLLSEVVGQELALRQLSDAVCDYLAQQQPLRPLILSAHGPPGVGKSLSHLLLARALYKKRPSADMRCPGSHCPGYKVLYGMDYVAAAQEEQHSRLRGAVVDHLQRNPSSLLVVEEYDKLDCPTRGLFRQLLENPQEANISSSRFIVILESNIGYPELHALLTKSGDREKIVPEEAERALKDLLFARWSAGNCEDRSDTLKLIGLVNFFLPYLPLERAHVRQLFEMRLRERGLTWEEEVLDFLTNKVDYEGGFPIEGAKEVNTLMTRYVSRALRDAAAGEPKDTGATLHLREDGMGLEAILHEDARPERPIV